MPACNDTMAMVKKLYNGLGGPVKNITRNSVFILFFF